MVIATGVASVAIAFALWRYRPQPTPALPSPFKGAPARPSYLQIVEFAVSRLHALCVRVTPRVSFAMQRRCVRFAWRLSARS